MRKHPAAHRQRPNWSTWIPRIIRWTGQILGLIAEIRKLF